MNDEASPAVGWYFHRTCDVRRLLHPSGERHRTRSAAGPTTPRGRTRRVTVLDSAEVQRRVVDDERRLAGRSLGAGEPIVTVCPAKAERLNDSGRSRWRR